MACGLMASEEDDCLAFHWRIAAVKFPTMLGSIRAGDQADEEHSRRRLANGEKENKLQRAGS